ncbi:MAG: hypothetical protein CXZ00_04810 [Acidobacteria bacterium]|nr:MAG: hypothetical protein CXZ00_04810 [Acidobacteriota bacterium]
MAARTKIEVKNILLTTDLTGTHKATLPFANALASRFDSKVHLLHVVTKVVYPELPVDSNLDYFADAGATYKTMVAIMNGIDRDNSKKEILLRGGSFWQVVEKVIQENNIDLVVMGSHGRGGITRLLTGSTAEQVYRHATCPVLTVGPKVAPAANKEFNRIVFATNFETHSEHALHHALGAAAEYNAQLIVTHVVVPSLGADVGLPEMLVPLVEPRLRTLLQNYDSPEKEPIYKVLVGSPADEIVKLAKAEHADLIVMGAKPAATFTTHGPLGPAHVVVARAPCPVLTVAF